MHETFPLLVQLFCGADNLVICALEAFPNVLPALSASLATRKRGLLRYVAIGRVDPEARAGHGEWIRALRRRAGPGDGLSDPRVAAAVRDTLLYGATERQLYDLDAWVVMPNHVHVLFAPKKPLAPIMHWLKRSTATRANRILGRSGAFWQAESYDHWIRTDQEWKSIVGYIEKKPVTAGLAASDDEWPWSSAWRSADNKIICATE
jgi:REP element-mobilizing transposase RayT